MLNLLNSLIVFIVVGFPTFQEAKINYLNNQKPYFVVLTAPWCGPCQVYKKNVIQPMYSRGEFSKVNLAVIDVDQARKEPETKKVVEFIVGDINNFSIPQTAIIYRTKDGWKKEVKKGMLSRQTVLQLIEAYNAK